MRRAVSQFHMRARDFAQSRRQVFRNILASLLSASRTAPSILETELNCYAPRWYGLITAMRLTATMTPTKTMNSQMRCLPKRPSEVEKRLNERIRILILATFDDFACARLKFYWDLYKIAFLHFKIILKKKTRFAFTENWSRYFYWIRDTRVKYAKLSAVNTQNCAKLVSWKMNRGRGLLRR